MASISDAPATSKKRQSCDRCHGQKLRCIRAGTKENDACNRCLRQGAQCIYSSSLPKGRPNMYRVRDTSTVPPNQPATTPVSGEHRRQNAAAIHTAPAGAPARADANGNMKEDVTLADPMDTSTSTSTWPWLDALNWNDMQIDGSENGSSQWTSDSHNMFDSPIDASTAFIDTFPGLLDWASVGNHENPGSTRKGPSSPPRPYDHGQGHGSDLFDSSSSSSNSSMIIDKNGPDAGIARLSQLSTRLYPLHRSICTLADAAESSGQSKDHNQVRQSPLIDDAAFKSVAAWLIHVSGDVNLLFRTDGRNPALETTSTGDALHDAFSASHHLLEILRCLKADVGNGTSSSTPTTSTGGAYLDFWASITPQASTSDENTSYFEQSKDSSSYARPSSQYSNTVVCHLVIACHTLLLNIYVAVLIALQHDADRWSSCRLAGNTDVDGDMDAAALTDIRLVLAVQLCSYLIKRQHQAVDVYLSPQPSSQQHDLSKSHWPTPPSSTTASREMMSELKMEVQQRLTRLRQTLRI